MKIVFLGLSITSSWGNGHATTYRGLLRELARQGHAVTFLERDVPWYRENRDMPAPPFGQTLLYAELDQLSSYTALVGEADAVVLGSYLPDGREVIDWALRHARGLTAFYDIDTPITLAALSDDDCAYLARRQVARFDLYLSFTGGPTLRRLERSFGARRARALYCSVDPELYFPEAHEPAWTLGYLGTYSSDRQPSLERLLLEPARALPEQAFVVAGPQYPSTVRWPHNVRRLTHVAPAGHRAFYGRQRFTLNITRQEMLRAGYSPSVRLFEAAACAVPIISDDWPGLETLFGPNEILVATRPEQVIEIIRDLPAAEAAAMGARARARILAQHTAAHRAAELARYIEEARMGGPGEEAAANVVEGAGA